MRKISSWLFVVTISIVLIVTFSLAGCKTTTTATAAAETTAAGETTAAAETTAAETTKAAERITLTLWTFESFSPATLKFVEGFEAVQDKYKLDLIYAASPTEPTMLTKWAAGDRPDIWNFHVFGNWFNQMKPFEKNLIDLSNEPFVKRATNKDAIKATTVDGKIYATTHESGIFGGLFYNKEIVAKLGLTPPKTAEEWLAFNDKCKAAGYDANSLAVGDLWSDQIISILLFASPIKKDPTIIDKINTGQDDFTNQVFLNGYEVMNEMLKRGHFNKDFLTRKYIDSWKAVMEGTAVSMAGLSNAVLDVAVAEYGMEEVDKKLGFQALSYDEDVMPTWAGMGWYLPNTGDPERIEGAKLFIEYITGGLAPERYQQYVDESKSSPLYEGFKNPEGLPLVVQQGIELVTAGKNDPVYSTRLIAGYGAAENFIGEMLAGQKTPLDVSKAMSDEFRKNAKVAGIEGF